MILGRVFGEVWSSRQHPSYEGKKLLLVRPLLWYSPTHEVGHLVAVDTVDAGIGDTVLVCMGEPARVACGGNDMPMEAAIAAVVDRVEMGTDVGKRPLEWLAPLEAA